MIALARMSVAELVNRFAEIGLAQDDALLHDDGAKLNRLFWQMKEVDEELRARGPNARQALLALYDHPNDQVRMKAAKHTLALAPAEARRVMEAVRDMGGPQAIEAGMSLWNLDQGIFKPT